MVPKLLLTLILSASYMFCNGSEDPILKVLCRSSRYPISVNCSWTQSPALSATKPTKFITTYRVGQKDSAETKTCIQPKLVFHSCIMDEIIRLSKEPHVLNITAVYPGRVTTTLFPFVLEDIIKPDPPLIIRVNPVSVNQLEVQWYPPWSWPQPDKFRLIYQLRYNRCKSNRFWQVVPTEHTILIIKVAHQNGKHCFQVNAQHRLGYGQPSEWSPIVVFPITSSK